LDDTVEVVPPALHEVLSLKVEDEKYVQLGPQQRRQHTFEAIRDVLIQESQRKPLILAAEDLHWIDKTSEEFLDYLIGFLPTARILLILLYRPEYTHAWGSKSYYGKIGLDQLSAQTSTELVQAILEGGDVAPEIAGLVLGRAGGNPLFVEELTHSLVENGSIQKKDHQFVLAQKASEIEVPDTIQGIIAARMDRIEDNLKRIMQAASVIGREFAYRILQSITGMSEDLKASLLNLQGLEFIYEKQLFPELEYIFKHALTQEVAYNSLLLKRRKEIHEKIGQAIEGLYAERLEEYYELLAYHYGRSDNKQKAVEYLDLANQKAAKANAMEAAKGHFDEAMKLLDSLPDIDETREMRISLLVNQSTIFLLLMKFPEYYELLTRHESLASGIGNAGLTGAFYACLALCEESFGLFDQSIQTATKAIQLCESAGNPQGAAVAYMCMAADCAFTGDFERLFACKEEMLRLIAERFNLFLYVRALTFSIMANALRGCWEEVVAEGDKALHVAQEFSDNSHISFAAAIISAASCFKGDLERALAFGELAVRKAPTFADKAWSNGFLAYAWCRNGESSRGIEVLAPLLQTIRGARHAVSELLFGNMLCEGYLLAGQCKEARKTGKEAVGLAERCGAKVHLAWAYRLLGEIDLKTNPSEAGSYFRQAICILQEFKAENELALAYSGMGRFHKQQGNVEQARKYLTDALEIFERLGTLIEPDKVRKELAELP